MEPAIGELVKRVHADLRAEQDAVLGARGLTAPQYAVLAALERRPGSSSAQLARWSFVTPQTMFRIVENLEAVGLLSRRPHPAHGKVLQTFLTPPGARLVASCHAEVDAVEARMLRGLSAPGRATLRKLLVSCAASLEGRPP